MKRLLFSFLIGISVADGSAQLTFTSTAEVGTYLEGGWSMFRTCGGFAGGCQYPSTLGFSKQIKFEKISTTSDSIAYTTYQNNVIVSSGRSKILPSSVMYGQKWTLDKIKTTQTQEMSLTLITSKTDSVFLADNCFDCYTTTYYRNKSVDIQAIQDAGALEMFPNPAGPELFFRKFEQDGLISITDLTGRIVLSVADIPSRLSLSFLKPGVYIVTLQTTLGSFRSKLVKE